MFGAKGLPRADRELGAVAASRINGCAYCASVHAQRFTQLTKQPEVMERIQADGVDAALEPRLKAILDYSAKLTRDPAAITAGRCGAAARAGPERPRHPRSHPRGRDVRLGEPADADARRAGRACARGKSAVIPVVFLHGIGGGARSFAPQIASFAAAGYQPVALDLLGYGDAHAGRGDELRGAGGGRRVHASRRTRWRSRCWSATRWAAWWCRPCCGAGRMAIAPPCSRVRRRRSAIRPATSRRSSSPIASRRSMPARRWPTSRRRRRPTLMGSECRSRRPRAVHRAIRG